MSPIYHLIGPYLLVTFHLNSTVHLISDLTKSSNRHKTNYLRLDLHNPPFGHPIDDGKISS